MGGNEGSVPSVCHGGRDCREEGREGEQSEHSSHHTVRRWQHNLQLQVDLLFLVLLHHDVLWRWHHATHGLNGRDEHDEQDDVKHGLDADGVLFIEDVFIISFVLLLLLDDEQWYVLHARGWQWWDVFASHAWNGDARLPLDAWHDHRRDALRSIHASPCSIGNPLHSHIPCVSEDTQGWGRCRLHGPLGRRFGHLGPAAVQGGQRLQAGAQHAAVQPGRHHNQTERSHFDHRGGGARGAVPAEARDPRQYRPRCHVLLILF